jgi:16S rRNA (cytidine1402-2'-O)-methyltransferase
MPGTLYVVATPIGNLEDVTLRALRVLREVAVIAAEDTRRTARLLQHYSISTPTTSLHEHNERQKSASLVERLRAGESIALVSDAGTPVVSDPGAHFVAQAHAAGIRVEPIPGPSAAVAALSAAGFSEKEVVFAGFPPIRVSDRQRWFSRLAKEDRVVILYEAPHRIARTLAEMLKAFGDRVVAMGRELTKAHEELVVRPISMHIDRLNDPRGEYTLVVRPEVIQDSTATRPAPSEAEMAAEFGDLTNAGGFGRREALKEIAERHGLKTREVYAAIERAKSSVE